VVVGLGKTVCQASCPKLLFTRIFHDSLALRTGFHIPDTDIIATALQAEATNFAPVRWSHVSNDSTHHDVLDGLAVWA
jgi:hypothetical protein